MERLAPLEYFSERRRCLKPGTNKTASDLPKLSVVDPPGFISKIAIHLSIST
jgi:hypothetical protein